MLLLITFNKSRSDFYVKEQFHHNPCSKELINLSKFLRNCIKEMIVFKFWVKRTNNVLFISISIVGSTAYLPIMLS